MKEAGTTHWLAPNTADNSELWTGLPGGNRHNNDGLFAGLGTLGFFWSSTAGPQNPIYSTGTGWRYALYNSLAISKNATTVQTGFSVRCLKD
jgi:uncharacterized protein (TIGR02145 family)